MLSPETVLQGRYRIMRQLGQGGMGAVYEAIDLRLDTVVALKETLFTDEKLRKQFEREARLLARLHHPALPRVSDHFTEGEGQFLVMQYIPGEDLFEMQTRRQGAFPQSDVLRWADQLCDALDYLHTQDPQIIHRDIKPQNLKLTSRGQVVLLDFGLAKGSAGQLTAVTTSASIFGYTPNYAPLEQVQGLGTDARSDIYSLAATLYHLLTNVKPPDALSRAGAVVNGMADPLVPADEVAPQVSPAVAHVLEVAMSQKRDDRYESAQMMREALNSAATGSLGEAATVLTSTGTTTKPNTVVPATGTQIAGGHTRGVASEARTLLAAEGTKVRAGTLTPETATVVRPVGSAKSSRTWIAAALVALVITGSAVGFWVYRARKSPQTVTTSPSPTESPVVQATPSLINEKAGQTATPENKAAAATQARSEQPKHTSKQTENATAKPTPASDSLNRDLLRHPSPPPTDQYVPPPDTPRPRPQEPRVQTFPNGTRMERRPDGTMVITFPNGATRVIPPGMPPPNRRRPRPNSTPQF
jgi:eukaryotic-like serine/threonine-protein kinase